MTAFAAEVRQTAPEGWPMHFESLITLLVVLTAIAIAWCLNHARPKVRAIGTFLAAALVRRSLWHRIYRKPERVPNAHGRS